jgi:hypothetical protein
MSREEKYLGISMDDVFGKMTDPMSGEYKRLSNGMIVARGLPYKEGSSEAKAIQEATVVEPIPQRCPVMGDLLPYKSVSVICEEKDYNAVTYWLEYVQGGGCVSNEKKLDDGKIFIRSNYMAW